MAVVFDEVTTISLGAGLGCAGGVGVGVTRTGTSEVDGFEIDFGD